MKRIYPEFLAGAVILALCSSLWAETSPSAPDLWDAGKQLREIIGGKIEDNAVSSIPGAVVKSDFDGLSMSAENANADTVSKRLRVKGVLKVWIPKLRLDTTEDLVRALTLFKAIYGTGRDGHSIDPATATLLDAREQDINARKAGRQGDAFRKLALGKGLIDSKGKPMKGGPRALYLGAWSFLGMPYYLSHNPNGPVADGRSSIDCSLFTKLAYLLAGLVKASFFRTADDQWWVAHKNSDGRWNSFKPGEGTPLAGDMVFFHHTYSVRAFDGVTHAGLYIANGGLGSNDAYIMAAGRSHGVSIQKISEVPCAEGWGAKCLHGYARVAKPMAMDDTQAREQALALDPDIILAEPPVD